MRGITLFDKAVRVEFTSDINPDRKFVIDSFNPSSNGIKPNMYISFRLIPNSTAIEFTLSLSNMTLAIDISEFTRMDILAGYGFKNSFFEATRTIQNNEMVMSLSAAIFSAFIEQPNPNGKTTFTGIVGSWMINNLNPSARNIRLRKPTIKVGDLLYGVLEGKDWTASSEVQAPDGGLGLTLVNGLDDWVLNIDITVSSDNTGSETVYWAESGYACLMWLQNQMITLGNNIIQSARTANAAAEAQGLPLPYDDPEKYKIATVIRDNEFFIFMKGFVNNLDLSVLDTYINLNKITSVTFQGAALSIVAPWIPGLIPGTIFYMESRYFRGRTSPSEVISVARDPKNLYRAITVDVEFDTTGTTNKMIILAVKADSFVHTPEDIEALSSPDVEQILEEDHNINADIIFGNFVQTVAQKNDEELWGTSGLDTTSYSEYTIEAGDTASNIARTRYEAEFNGGKSLKIVAPNHISDGTYFEAPSLWPAIIATSHALAVDGVELFREYLNHPDVLIPGEKLAIPPITSVDDISSKGFRDAFEHMADNWERLAAESAPTVQYIFNQDDIFALRAIVAHIDNL